MTDYVADKAKNAPRTPGVYLMKGAEGEVLYVGKARDIRSRIKAYFEGKDSRVMVPFLVSRVSDIDFIVTRTEKEALILENNLIKEHRPRYNVNFRDDKTYFHIRLDPRESFPRFQLVRRPKRDGARYFGPYPSSASAKETLRFLQPVFPLRTCGNPELNGRRRPCLEYEIGRCPAPCCGLILVKDYQKLVDDAVAFMEGRQKRLVAELRLRMKEASEQMQFEAAAVLRDRIAAIERTLEKQRMASMASQDQDIFGLFRQGDATQICAIIIRGGNIIGQKTYPLIRIGGETTEILSGLIKQYYDTDVDIPSQIILPAALEDRAVVAEWLEEKKGRPVSLRVPRKGKALALMEMARQNAENVYRTERMAKDNIDEALDQVVANLNLKKKPVRIECFDISNISGTSAVGSMVTFVSGLPEKSSYRRFRIKTVEGADDYAMMYEVLRRRYEKKENMPDLVMVDGGRGQLGVALTALKDLAIKNVDVVAIAKERDETPPRGGVRSGKAMAKDYERIYLPGRKNPVNLSRYHAALFLLQRIRDEAHRFAITYHRKLREKRDTHSVLDNIPGLGPTRRNALLKHFGDIAKIMEASKESLQMVDGIGKATAEQIYDFLRR